MSQKEGDNELLNSVVQQIGKKMEDAIISFFIDPNNRHRDTVLRQVIETFNTDAEFFELEQSKVNEDYTRYMYSFYRVTLANYVRNFHNGFYVMVYRGRDELNMFKGLVSSNFEISRNLDPRIDDKKTELLNKAMKQIWKNRGRPIMYFELDSDNYGVKKEIITQIDRAFSDYMDTYCLVTYVENSKKECYYYRYAPTSNLKCTFAIQLISRSEKIFRNDKDGGCWKIEDFKEIEPFLDVSNDPDDDYEMPDNLKSLSKEIYNIQIKFKSKPLAEFDREPPKNQVPAQLPNANLCFHHDPEIDRKLSFLKEKDPDAFDILQLARFKNYNEASERDRQLIENMFDDYDAQEKDEQKRKDDERKKRAAGLIERADQLRSKKNTQP
jgi:hypothetical protein